jgi:hypothetical protein
MDYVRIMLLEDSDSEDELELLTAIVLAHKYFNREGGSTSRRGSVPGRTYIDRDFLQGHQRLFLDYFADSPVYPPKVFRRRFRMHRHLFRRIQSAVEVYDPYFVQTRNCAGTLGLSSIQKMTAAFRMLTHGVAADYVDEYVRIGKTTAIESLEKFVKAVVSIYSNNYLRSPNIDDVAKLLEVGERRGFPGMLGSIDCMHWKWKNCPTGWKGMFSRHCHEPTMILEAVASQDLWIWHAFFGLPGSQNDINVLEQSSVFSVLTEGRAPLANYSVNGHNYTLGYYLADGIYPQRSAFVKAIACPQGKKAKQFAAFHESTRKDVERAFEVLQARFAIIRGPKRGWNREMLKYIMKACIILHNMIIEDERNTDDAIDFEYEQIGETPHVQISREYTPEFVEFIQRHLSTRHNQTHSQLKSDLNEHLWQLHLKNC